MTESDEEDRLWNQGWRTFERWYDGVVLEYAASADHEKQRLIEERMGGDDALDEEDAEEEAREDFDQWLWETLDGSHALVYTNQARVILLISRNRDAYVDDFGEAPTTTEAAAFWALRTDVLERMES